jgi:hypothetical protein
MKELIRNSELRLNGHKKQFENIYKTEKSLGDTPIDDKIREIIFIYKSHLRDTKKFEQQHLKRLLCH